MVYNLNNGTLLFFITTKFCMKLDQSKSLKILKYNA